MEKLARKKSDQFEDGLKRLQEIVDKLEKGDMPLEEAMESFTEGIRLAQFCHRKLEEAENKVRGSKLRISTEDGNSRRRKTRSACC